MPSDQGHHQLSHHFGGFLSVALHRAKSKSSENLNSIEGASTSPKQKKRVFSSRDLTSGAGSDSEPSKQRMLKNSADTSSKQKELPQINKPRKCCAADTVPFSVKYSVAKEKKSTMSTAVMTSSPIIPAVSDTLDQALQDIKIKLKEMTAERTDMENRMEEIEDGIENMYFQYGIQQQPNPNITAGSHNSNSKSRYLTTVNNSWQPGDQNELIRNETKISSITDDAHYLTTTPPASPQNSRAVSQPEQESSAQLEKGSSSQLFSQPSSQQGSSSPLVVKSLSRRSSLQLVQGPSRRSSLQLLPLQLAWESPPTEVHTPTKSNAPQHNQTAKKPLQPTTEQRLSPTQKVSFQRSPARKQFDPTSPGKVPPYCNTSSALSPQPNLGNLRNKASPLIHRNSFPYDLLITRTSDSANDPKCNTPRRRISTPSSGFLRRSSLSESSKCSSPQMLTKRAISKNKEDHHTWYEDF